MIKTKILKSKFSKSIIIVYLFSISIILSVEFLVINHNFIEEHKSKNKTITKITSSLLETLKDETTKKVDFFLSDKKILEAFANKDREKLYKFMKFYYKKYTSINPYIKIMTFRDIDGSTFLRVHKPEKFGDKLNQKREIILETNKTKTPHYGFEVGKLKMTYRVVIPIFYKQEHIGLVEVGIEPEYLIDKISSTFDLKHALLVNKDFLSVLLNQQKDVKLIDNFAMVRGDKFFFDNINNIDLTNSKDFINYKDKTYIIESNLNLLDYKNNISAKLLFASEINNFDNRNYILLITFIFTTIFFLILFFIINKIMNRFINIQEMQTKQIKAIFEGSSSLLVLSNGKEVIDANQDFINKNECICNRFEDYDEKEYIRKKMQDDIDWIDYILLHKDKTHKVVMLKNGIEHHFTIQINKVSIDNNTLYVIDFNDITNDVIQKKELKKQSDIIINQTKMAALGEMIGNIAHQWRQPLCTISACASGMQLQKDYDLLTDELFQESCELITENTEYLSQTIDTFRDFIKGENKKELFNLKNELNKTINLLQGLITNHNINIVVNISEDIEINTTKNELTQCLVNIFNNAKDILNDRKVEEKYIFIDNKLNDKDIEIIIKDNAGGIEEDVLPKIFEPYFTTKHKSQGTGLGLNMTYNLIVNGMGGYIKAKNVEYEYENKKYKGAQFTITLPLS